MGILWLSVRVRGAGDVSELVIATEFCAGGNLFDAIAKGTVSGESEIIKAFMQVCHAVEHMHSLSKPLIHRDLKLANVYFNTATGKWVLGDFGRFVGGWLALLHVLFYTKPLFLPATACCFQI